MKNILNQWTNELTSNSYKMNKEMIDERMNEY